MGPRAGSARRSAAWRRAVAGLAVFVAVAGGSSIAAAEEWPQRATGEEVAEAAEAVGSAPAADAPVAGAAAAPVPLPDLGLAPRRPDGGMTLYRMPLSDLEGDVGTASRLRSLPMITGYSYDKAKIVAGDFADFTAGDDGTADTVIYHAGSDGSARIYVVGGGSDTAPRLLRVLPKSAGWSWADSRPLAGDVNGDAWDDLVIVHRARAGTIVWVMPSDGVGGGLGAPVRWGSMPGDFGSTRNHLADADWDGVADLLTTGPGAVGVAFTTSVLLSRPDGSGSLGWRAGASFTTAAGWSFADSRQLAGDVDGDGMADLVTIARSGSGGVLVWVSVNCSAADGDVCWEAPTRWQTLTTGWSFANSRQYLADTDGDFVDDLVSVHRSGSGGMIAWRHVSNRTVFTAPQQLANLTSASGWNWSSSKESVANTWGLHSAT